MNMPPACVCVCVWFQRRERPYRSRTVRSKRLRITFSSEIRGRRRSAGYRRADDLLYIRHAAAALYNNNNNNNNNTNSHDNVYGAVIMTKVIARVHPVHLMNVD